MSIVTVPPESWHRKGQPSCRAARGSRPPRSPWIAQRPAVLGADRRRSCRSRSWRPSTGRPYGSRRGSSRIAFTDDSPTTLGPKFGAAWTLVSVEIPKDGGYGIGLDGPSTGTTPQDFASWSVRIERCGFGCDRYLMQSGAFDLHSLEAGRYLIRVSRPEGEPSQTTFGVRIEDAFGDGVALCAANPP